MGQIWPVELFYQEAGGMAGGGNWVAIEYGVLSRHKDWRLEGEQELIQP